MERVHFRQNIWKWLFQPLKWWWFEKICHKYEITSLEISDFLSKTFLLYVLDQKAFCVFWLKILWIIWILVLPYFGVLLLFSHAHVLVLTIEKRRFRGRIRNLFLNSDCATPYLSQKHRKQQKDKSNYVTKKFLILPLNLFSSLCEIRSIRKS